ncbi:unnamed protein product [Closterium sp. Naga37s-1]|nr:unnamed protein product [Closterium sp. Naga37s-1]
MREAPPKARSPLPILPARSKDCKLVSPRYKKLALSTGSGTSGSSSGSHLAGATGQPITSSHVAVVGTVAVLGHVHAALREEVGEKAGGEGGLVAEGGEEEGVVAGRGNEGGEQGGLVEEGGKERAVGGELVAERVEEGGEERGLAARGGDEGGVVAQGGNEGATHAGRRGIQAGSGASDNSRRNRSGMYCNQRCWL